jgi:uncharacterized membrane protein YeaQ/YmgE (transglycosylase-associated protein family)
MNLVLWILFGSLVGWIASLMINNLSVRQAELMTVLGVVAGILGGWLISVLTNQSINNFNIYSVISAVFMATVGILVYGRLFLASDK